MNRSNSNRSKPNFRSKRLHFGTPRKSGTFSLRNERSAYIPPEDWHEPIPDDERDGYRVITQSPGPGFVHVVNADEVIERLASLPMWMTNFLDVVQLSRMTKKKMRFPCYGMQWGTALYLYPIEDSLTETFHRPPAPQLLTETKMFGGKWLEDGVGVWKLVWSWKAIKDFYLNNILIHELGHLLDDRNRSYVDRERYAEWFAIEYGYRRSRDTQKKKRIKKRHHAS